MKQLAKVIHPELLLDLRGDMETRSYLRTFMSLVEYLESESRWAVKGKLLEAFQEDRNVPAIAFTLKRYTEAREKKVYYVPKDFALAISKIDKGIPAAILQPGFIAYFELGAGAFDGAQGGYVYIDTAHRMGLRDRDGERSADNEVCITVVFFDEKGAASRYSGDLRNDLSLRGKLDTAVETHGAGCSGRVDNTVIQCLINAAIYVHSSDPDMANLVPRREMTKPEREHSRSKYHIENMCTLPMTILNRSYAVGRQYSSETATVGAHLRWQRHGIGNSQVKLILIEEFVRRNPGHG